MKASLIGLAALSLVALTASETETGNSNISKDMSGELIACGWYPLCGDPDIYSPALEPKDAAREVRSVKEDKVSLTLVV